MSDKRRKVGRKQVIGVHLAVWLVVGCLAYMVWMVNTKISEMEGYHVASFAGGLVAGMVGMCAFYLACSLIEPMVRWLYRRHKSKHQDAKKAPAANQ